MKKEMIQITVRVNQYVVFGLVMLLTSFSAVAGDDADLVIYKDGFFSPATYSIDNGEKKPTVGFFSLSNHFVDVFKGDPEAYRLIKQANTSSAIATLGSGVMLLGSVMMLLSTLEEADNVNNGRTSNNSSGSSSGLGFVIAGAVVVLVSGQIASSKLKNAVKRYNKGQKISYRLNNNKGFRMAENKFLDFSLGRNNKSDLTINAIYKYYF